MTRHGGAARAAGILREGGHALAPRYIAAMDGWAVTGSVASVIAAAGVIWERAEWWRNRPRTSIEVELGAKRYLGNHDFGGRLFNRGTEPISRIVVVGFGCRVEHTPLQEVESIEPNSGLMFDIHAAGEDLELAWALITWMSASTPQVIRAEWFPLFTVGNLAEVRARQLSWSAPRRAAARLAFGAVPTPMSVARGRGPTLTPRDLRQAEIGEFVRAPARWRLLVALVLRVLPAPRAIEAMGLE